MSMSPGSHDGGVRQWGTGHTLRLVCTVLAVLALAGAIVIVVLPLPKPAAGGTCGPGSGSESAIVAFFDPVSIGAGSASSATTTEEALDRLAFIGECQSASNGRMVDALALVILAGLFALALPPVVRRAWQHEAPALATGGGAPPGWYPDPANPSGWRWWDGHLWGNHSTAGTYQGWGSTRPPGTQATNPADTPPPAGPPAEQSPTGPPAEPPAAPPSAPLYPEASGGQGVAPGSGDSPGAP